MLLFIIFLFHKTIHMEIVSILHHIHKSYPLPPRFSAIILFITLPHLSWTQETGSKHGSQGLGCHHVFRDAGDPVEHVDQALQEEGVCGG